MIHGRVDMEFLFECLTLKMKACVESLQKQTMGLVFNVKKSQFLSWSLPTEEIFQVHGQNRVAPNLKWSIFVLSHKICHYPKQLNE